MYQHLLSDLQKTTTLPWSYLAEMTRNAMTNPMSPLSYTVLGRAFAAHAHLFEANAMPVAKPPFGLHTTSFRGDSIRVNELSVDRHPFCDLVFFERTSKIASAIDHISGDPKVLIVPPMIGHYATLARDVVRDMLPSHNVFVTDWVDARMVPLSSGYFDMDDQIAWLIHAMRKIAAPLHVIAIGPSAPSVFSAVALMAAHNDPAQPQSISLIAGPIDARGGGCIITEAVKKHTLSWFRKNRIEMVPFYYPGALRRVYMGQAQMQNRMALVTGKTMEERMKFFNHMTRGTDETPQAYQKLYKEFLSLMDITEEYFIQFIERAYLNHALATGSLVWRGEKVDPAAIKNTAIMAIEGELDDFSPPGHTRAALALCSNLAESKKEAHLEIGARHYATFMGRRWRNSIQPLIHTFIRRHAETYDPTQFYTPVGTDMG